MNREIVRALYTAIVRPLLDYGTQCWTPFLAKDTEQLEKVQHRATKLVAGDIIQVYKIFHGCDDLPATRFFQLSTTNLRGHSLKITKLENCTKGQCILHLNNQQLECPP